MGFLKFMKKRDEPKQLDLPPAPPEFSIPDFPEVAKPVPPPPIEPEKKQLEVPEPTVDIQKEPEIPEPEEVEHSVSTIFARSDNFQKVLGRIKSAKAKLKELEDRLVNLNELKNKEEREFNLWRTKLEDIQRKLIYIDRVAFENEG